MMNLLAYCDGNNDLIQVADLIKKPAWVLYVTVNKLKEHCLLTVAESSQLK